MRSHNFFLLAYQNQLDKACYAVFSLGAINISNREFHYTCLFMMILCFIWCQANPGSLGVGEYTPWHNSIIHFLLANWYKCIAYCKSCLICCHMREEVSTNNISDRENIWC